MSSINLIMSHQDSHSVLKQELTLIWYSSITVARSTGIRLIPGCNFISTLVKMIICHTLMECFYLVSSTHK